MSKFYFIDKKASFHLLIVKLNAFLVGEMYPKCNVPSQSAITCSRLNDGWGRDVFARK